MSMALPSVSESTFSSRPPDDSNIIIDPTNPGSANVPVTETIPPPVTLNKNSSTGDAASFSSSNMPPIATSAKANHKSVVPDLMEVYDALTHSSTPQASMTPLILEMAHHSENDSSTVTSSGRLTNFIQSTSPNQAELAVNSSFSKTASNPEVETGLAVSASSRDINSNIRVDSNGASASIPKRFSKRKSPCSDSENISTLDAGDDTISPEIVTQTSSGTIEPGDRANRNELRSGKRKTNLSNAGSEVVAPVVVKSRRSKKPKPAEGSNRASFELEDTGGTPKSNFSQCQSQDHQQIHTIDYSTRKKGKTCSSDLRWSKRFTWPDELHRDFVSAVFDVGLKHSSPSAILEHMRPNPDVTSERVKSHLQKYRLHRQKSRREFMASYDIALEGFQKRQQQIRNEAEESHEPNRPKKEPTTREGDLDLFKSYDVSGTESNLSCGEAAAHCTHAVLSECGINSDDVPNGRRQEQKKQLVSMNSHHLLPLEASTPTQGKGTGNSSAQGITEFSVPCQSVTSTVNDRALAEIEGISALQLPLLTSEERDSPLGQSFGYLVGIFQTLMLQLGQSRESKTMLLGAGKGPLPPSDPSQLFHQGAHEKVKQEEAKDRLPNSHSEVEKCHNRHPSGPTPQSQLVRQQAAHLCEERPCQQYHHSTHVVVEQAVATAATAATAATVHGPSIHEIAVSIPHAVLMGPQPGQYYAHCCCPQEHCRYQQNSVQHQHPRQIGMRTANSESVDKSDEEIGGATQPQQGAERAEFHSNQEQPPQLHQQHCLFRVPVPNHAHPPRQGGEIAADYLQQRYLYSSQCQHHTARHYHQQPELHPSHPPDDPSESASRPECPQAGQPHSIYTAKAPHEPMKYRKTARPLPPSQAMIQHAPSVSSTGSSTGNHEMHNSSDHHPNSMQRQLSQSRVPTEHRLPLQQQPESQYYQQLTPQQQPGQQPQKQIPSQKQPELHRQQNTQRQRQSFQNFAEVNGVCQLETYDAGTAGPTNHLNQPRTLKLSTISMPTSVATSINKSEAIGLSCSNPSSLLTPNDAGSNCNTSLSGTGRTLQAQKESDMMKQEMQNQMAFQNKMRALKQIELSKYGGGGNEPGSTIEASWHGSTEQEYFSANLKKNTTDVDLSKEERVSGVYVEKVKLPLTTNNDASSLANPQKNDIDNKASTPGGEGPGETPETTFGIFNDASRNHVEKSIPGFFAVRMNRPLNSCEEDKRNGDSCNTQQENQTNSPLQPRSLSEAPDQEFWNSDEVDDQLFDFLMET